MPPKKRSYNTKSTKSSDKDQVTVTKKIKREEKDAREQAKKHNQSFLQDALISAKTECSDDVYSQSGHVFVSVQSAFTSSGGSIVQDIFQDPLDLSQKSMLSQEQPHKKKVVNKKKGVTFERKRKNTTTIQQQQLAAGQLPPSPVPSSTQMVPQSLPEASTETPQPTTITIQQQQLAAGQLPPSPVPSCTQMAPQSLPEASTETPQPSQRSPPHQLASSVENLLEGCSDMENDNQHSTQLSKKESHSKLPPRSLQNQFMASATEDPQEGCSYNVDTDDNSDCDIDNNTDTRNDEKYTKLLVKYRQKCKTLSNLRKKYDSLKHNFAELKDVVVYATAEAKKAKTDPNANRTFTLDPDVNITVEKLEEINLMSKSVANFAQNLSMYLYGAENLRQKSVTGRSCNRLKGAPPTRPAMTPTKLQFIYNKARQRVALEKGADNHAQIASLADETIINRAIAEKIANLNKAVKYAALRDQERRSSTSNSVR